MTQMPPLAWPDFVERFGKSFSRPVAGKQRFEKMDSFERKFVVFGTIGVIAFFATFIVINHLLGEITKAFYWGLPIGITLGIPTCLLISRSWDPVYLQPKNPGDTQDGRLTRWAIPFGVFVANIVVRIFSREAADFVLGITLGWLFVTLGYLASSAWYHRPG